MNDHQEIRRNLYKSLRTNLILLYLQGVCTTIAVAGYILSADAWISLFVTFSIFASIYTIRNGLKSAKVDLDLIAPSVVKLSTSKSKNPSVTIIRPVPTDVEYSEDEENFYIEIKY